MLKPGGTLVYCTCSLEPEEGEAHVAPLLARQPLALQPIAADEVGGLAETIAPGGTLRTLPVHLPNPVARLSGLDGFFAARFIKRG
jgi:16S rRNA (cytosine967-C5)-methyltransferase